MSYKTAFYVAAACLTLAILGNQLNYLNSLKQRELGRVEMKVWQDQWYAAHPVMPCAYAVYRADTDSKYRLYDVLTIGDCKDNPRPVVDVPPAPKPAPRKAEKSPSIGYDTIEEALKHGKGTDCLLVDSQGKYRTGPCGPQPEKWNPHHSCSSYLTGAGWQPIASAPRDGSIIELGQIYGIQAWEGLFYYKNGNWIDATDENMMAMEDDCLYWRPAPQNWQ